MAVVRRRRYSNPQYTGQGEAALTRGLLPRAKRPSVGLLLPVTDGPRDCQHPALEKPGNANMKGGTGSGVEWRQPS
jgi:hypothetical protein